MHAYGLMYKCQIPMTGFIFSYDRSPKDLSLIYIYKKDPNCSRKRNRPKRKKEQDMKQ